MIPTMIMKVIGIPSTGALLKEAAIKSLAEDALVLWQRRMRLALSKRPIPAKTRQMSPAIVMIT